MIIDTHIHLDSQSYIEDLDAVIERSKQGGVEKFIIPGADCNTIEYAVNISQNNDDIYFATGIHPYDIDSFDDTKSLEAYIEKYVNHKKCIAIGECGLDYFRLEGTDEEKELEKNKQKEIFIVQINLAKKYNKPLIVHIRDASNDAKEILLNHDAGEVGGVLHCFNADEQLLSLANHNFYFGIGGVLTFKNAKKLVNVLAKIPTDKLLIETDGPYLTPTPHRGKRNEPLYCKLIADKIADILQISSEDIEDLTTKNAIKLFDI